MTNRLCINVALLSAMISNLPQIDYNDNWDATEEGARPGLMNDGELLAVLPEGEVHYCFDLDGALLFIVKHDNELNLIQKRGDTVDNCVQLFFDGSEKVAAVLEAPADGGGVTLGNLAAFFVFFGPQSVADLVNEAITKADADDMAEIRAISPKSADCLDRLNGREAAADAAEAIDTVLDKVPDCNRVEMMIREPRTIHLDSGWKKIGALGVLGLAGYGLFRLLAR